MPSQQKMKDALQAYIDGFNAADAEVLISLFAENATVEDPVGGTLLVGREAIAAFYRGSVTMVKNIRLAAPIRGSHADAAAMAFTVELVWDGRPCEIDVIDVMRFDDTGLICSMKAYWGTEDVRFVD